MHGVQDAEGSNPFAPIKNSHLLNAFFEINKERFGFICKKGNPPNEEPF